MSPVGMALPRSLLSDLYRAAVDAARPRNCLPQFIPEPCAGDTWLLAIGKAAVPMAAVFAERYAGSFQGLAITRYGHGLATGQSITATEVLESGHPLPDAASCAAADRVSQWLRGCDSSDRLVVMLSGGGSALLCAPAEGIDLGAKQAITRHLMNSGATISELNCVRKHLSAVKGGRLAGQVAAAEIIVLILSDVPGDDIGDVASGPFSPDSSTRQDAQVFLEHYDCPYSEAVAQYLQSPASETPKPGDALFAKVRTAVVACGATALEAAARHAEQESCEVLNLGAALEGDAGQLAREHAAILLERATRPGKFVLLSGGESTVRIANENGCGGRNTEYLLALALALQGRKGVYALAADTDGIDGTEDNAGAIITPDTLERAQASGIDGAALLAQNRSYDFFSALNDLIVPGPTGTNVNDFRAVLSGF
ncbi:MAG: glycerate kinase type-2 family protein [Gammaproteobacteria bacterium]